MRILLTVEYDGTEYSGWQRQKNAPSIQEKIETAIFELTGERVTVTGAGRTDAGVHALGQKAHFDTIANIPPNKFAFALNTKLPTDIRVRASEQQKDNFHATLSAKKKWYRYTIYREIHANAVGYRYSTHVYYPLDIDLMQREAKALCGTHDFAAFQSTGSQIKTTVRTIEKAEVTQEGDYIMIDLIGNGFLYNMVRIIAGTLIEIGAKKRESGAVGRALLSGMRTDAGMTAEAKGLCMMKVWYA